MVLTKNSIYYHHVPEDRLFSTGVVVLSYLGVLLDQLKRRILSELGRMIQRLSSGCAMFDWRNSMREFLQNRR